MNQFLELVEHQRFFFNGISFSRFVVFLFDVTDSICFHDIPRSENPLASKLETLRFSPQKGTGNFFGRCGGHVKLETRGKDCRIGRGETNNGGGVKPPAFCELSMCLAGKKGREKKKNRVLM